MGNLIENYTLCINCGSSGLKFSLYKAAMRTLKLSEEVDRIGQKKCSVEDRRSQRPVISQQNRAFPGF